jgi:hypothetical protein
MEAVYVEQSNRMGRTRVERLSSLADLVADHRLDYWLSRLAANPHMEVRADGYLAQMDRYGNRIALPADHRDWYCGRWFEEKDYINSQSFGVVYRRNCSTFRKRTNDRSKRGESFSISHPNTFAESAASVVTGAYSGAGLRAAD